MIVPFSNIFTHSFSVLSNIITRTTFLTLFLYTRVNHFSFGEVAAALVRRGCPSPFPLKNAANTILLLSANFLPSLATYNSATASAMTIPAGGSDTCASYHGCRERFS